MIMKISPFHSLIGIFALTALACTGGSGGSGSASDPFQNRSYRVWNAMHDGVGAVDFFRDNAALETSSSVVISNDVAQNTPSARSQFYSGQTQMNIRVTNPTGTATFFSNDVIQLASDRHIITAYGPGSSTAGVVVLPFETSRVDQAKKNQIVCAHTLNPANLTGFPNQLDVHVSTTMTPSATTKIMSLLTYNPSRPADQVKLENTNFEGAHNVLFTRTGTLDVVASVSGVNFINGNHYFFVLSKTTTNTPRVFTWNETYGAPAP
jgi:hypothetical protein